MSKMRLKKITLTIPEPMLRKLQNEQKNFSYPTVQAIILEALRNRYFKYERKGKGGRPRKLDLMRVGSAKKVFE